MSGSFQHGMVSPANPSNHRERRWRYLMSQQIDSHQCYQLMLYNGTPTQTPACLPFFFSLFFTFLFSLFPFNVHVVLSFVLAEIRCINYEWLTKYTPVPEAAHQSFFTCRQVIDASPAGASPSGKRRKELNLLSGFEQMICI